MVLRNGRLHGAHELDVHIVRADVEVAASGSCPLCGGALVGLMGLTKAVPPPGVFCTSAWSFGCLVIGVAPGIGWAGPLVP